MKFLSLLLPAFLSTAIQANEIPPAVIPAGVGVNIHFVRGQKKDLDMIAAAGFKWIRMDFAWESIEQTNGVYDWSAYEELTVNLQKRGLGAIYILDYSNPIYEQSVDSKNGVTQAAERGVASPQHAASIEAYSRWATAAAVHFRGEHIIWEFWNEPNGSFWKPKPNASQYAALAVCAASAIRLAEPDATIIGPASAGFPWPFLETFLKSSVLENLDAVSVHPYRDFKKGPETAGADYDRLRGMIEQYAPTEVKKHMPIISGEWGYSTQTGGVSLDTQAAYAVRQQLFNLMHGVPLSIWYDWKNDGKDAGYNEHNFGTVTDDLQPKPAYLAIKNMTTQLRGYVFKQRIAPRENDYLLIFMGLPGKKITAWTTGQPHQVKASFGSPNGVSGVDGMGASFTPQIEDGKLVIDLESLPKYITAK